MKTFLPEYLDLSIYLPPLDEARDAFMATYLRTALMRHHGHQQKAAAEMGIHRNTLMRLCDQTGVPRRYGLPTKRRPNPTEAAARRLIGLKPLPPKKPVRAITADDLPAWSPIRAKMLDQMRRQA